MISRASRAHITLLAAHFLEQDKDWAVKAFIRCLRITVAPALQGSFTISIKGINDF